MDERYLISLDDITFGTKIGEYKNATTYQSNLLAYSSKCVTKIMNNESQDTESKFIKYIQLLQQTNHFGIIPFIGFSSSSKNIMKQNIIVTKFASYNSLQHIFDQINKGEDLSWFDPVRKFIILYGIAHSMDYLHSLNIIHEKLTPSNILLDENAEPQITDFQLSMIYPSYDYSIQNLINDKLFYYIDPFTLNNNGKITSKSDVYSFAIITIQILTANTHIYENEDDLETLINDIKNGQLPMIPENFPNELRELLISCLNNDPTSRPTFKQICDKLDSIIDSLPDISTEIFKEYKEKISGIKISDSISSKILQMKDAADKGDPEMMYLYANNLLNGINCRKNQSEAIKYFKMAKKKGHQAAIQQLNLLKFDSGSMANPVSNETLNINQSISNDVNYQINQQNDDNDYKEIKNNGISCLADDLTYDQPELNIDDILQKKNFIFTEGVEERLKKLYYYISVGIPVLLIGPTGTSKTLSSEIICELLKCPLIRFIISSETKTQDLIGQYVVDNDSWTGISQKDGPFSKAFEQGYALLLEGINFASDSVIKCIKDALDSGVLSIEIAGRPLKRIRMNRNFRVIATQNTINGSYAHRRQNPWLKFYSMFQIINFPEFTEEELLLIGQGFADIFGYKEKEVVDDLVKFHKEWSENPLIADDAKCISIREIAATVKALSQNVSIYDTIMTIYGARYQKSLKEQLNNVLKKYPRLINDTKKFDFPNFPGCYINDSLSSAVKSTFFSLKNGRNVILTGKEGCGKTQVALWISEYYNNKIQNTENDKHSFFCVCTEEIKVADLVGHQKPSGKSDGTSELIKWKDGFLTKAIKFGMCSVLENIDEAPTKVTERLYSLIDQKNDNQQKYFDIPENSSKSCVLIKNSFRILATANIDKISQISPAFLNKFDIIVLENQINDDIDQNQFYDLLKTILDKYCSDLMLRTKTPDSDNEYSDVLNFFFSGSDNEYSDVLDFSDSDNDDEDNSNDNESNSIATQKDDQQVNSITYSENIITMIYEKMKNEKNISRISRICNAIIKLLAAFKSNSNITDKDIVDFGFLLLQNNKEFDIPKEIEKELLNTFRPIEDITDDPFFYKDSPTLCSFLAKLAAYSIIEQPVCVSGPTGVGKTSAARAFARMRPHQSNIKSGFQMHSFHSGTKVSHFFGSTTLLDGKIVFHDGTLTKSLKLGLVFIADEFNLSTQSVMKSLALALDPTIGKNVFIPGIGQIINISPEFHFIACQNELGTLGRNAIPDSIAQRFVYIDYPKPQKEDIQKICINISKENFTPPLVFTQADEDLACNIANYMIKLNDRKLIYIPQWSLRDITKLFRRIYPQNSFKKFKDITPLHHVLFYTMSVVPPNDVANVIDDIRSIMKISFNLSDDEVNEYIECHKAPPEIREIKKQGLYLMKGPKSGISINSFKQLMIDNELPSLWNAIFQVYLSDEKEPILLMGNSGFKTFLARHFLPRAQIITLNQETNVAQLLGSSGFMTNSEAKLFYIDYICKIIQNDSMISELREKWYYGNLKEEDVIPLIKIAHYLPSSFHYSLNHLAEKLFIDQATNQECILSNTTLEFRPGLFLNSILQGQSLILKDLSNLPTFVLERFNELFSGKQNITLSEDIHNTFTPPDYKELTDFNYSFRVFATCPANSQDRLSEDILSRFTVISVPGYSSNEQEIVLKSYIQINKLIFNASQIGLLIQFALSYQTALKIHFTFPQMIKVIEITSKINQKTSIDIQKLNIGITLYRVLGGLLESNKKKEILYNQIKIYFDIPPLYQNQKNVECPLLIQQKYNITGVTSNISNLFLKCISAHECQQKVAFTKSFNDLLDLIHMALTIHNPLILEGSPGQGKHTAINYIAKLLDYEIVHFMISQSTKVEDLFGKYTISRQQDEITQFVRIIESTHKKFLIILENINNSSPTLLNALAPVFDSHSTSILLPNGSSIEKGKFDIIGIFKTRQVSSSKDKLPPSLINSSIYHVVSKPKKSEIWRIIWNNFDNAYLSKEEAVHFNNRFIKLRKLLSKEGISSEVFTLNEIEKYILFRTSTKNFFDETTISQIIFAYKFSSDEMIQKILEELNLVNMTFSPLFNYDFKSKSLLIRISNDESNCLVLPLISPNLEISTLSKIYSLTLPQKHCLIFLACSLLSKRACVIQGDTASGKSYLIRLFSKIVGAKLIVFQMNNDSNTSMLAGQSVLYDEISEEDKYELEKALADIKYLLNNDFRNEVSIIEDILYNDFRYFRKNTLKSLLKYIKRIEPEIQRKSYFPEIQRAVQVIKEIMNPVNHFEHIESAFIHALRNGEWVLIDGIESAPSIIAEKISSLCGENPELNLFEYGPDFFFSKNNLNPENRINNFFHLFITFNPCSMKESQMIDLTFLHKCVTFTLPTIDERIENSAQMMLGSLINLSHTSEVSKEVAARYAQMHQFVRSESQNHPDDFADDIQYNGRTLKFVTKVFSILDYNQDQNILAKQISFSTKLFYLNSYTNEKKFHYFYTNCLKSFKQKPREELLIHLQTGDMTPEIRNKKILHLLRNIQMHTLGRSDHSSYSLSYFLELCSFIRISDVPYVQSYIKETLKIIQSMSSQDESNQKQLIQDPIIMYGVLYCINSLFEIIISPEYPIKHKHTFLYLRDKKLRNKNKAISEPLLKFDLLIQLLRIGLFSEQSSIVLGNDTYSNIINQISIIASNFDKKLIPKIFKQIESNISLIDFVDKIFPYSAFKESDLFRISYWLPLAKILIKNEIPFSYTINDVYIKFNEFADTDFSVDLIMNEERNLSLSKNSIIHYSNKKMSLKIQKHDESENEKYDLIFYDLINTLSSNPKQIFGKKLINALFSKSGERFLKKSIQNLSVNRMMSLKELFQQKQIPLINLIWNLVFTLPENEIVDLSKIIHPIESKLLLSSETIFNYIDNIIINDIVEWSKWASQLEKSIPILYQSVLGFDITQKVTSSNIDDFIHSINEEIIYLKEAPERMKIYWNSHDLINMCQKELIQLTKMKNNIENSEKEIRIQKKINDMKIHLVNTKISQKYNKMKDELINRLNLITDFTDDSYVFAHKIFDRFLQIVNSSDQEDTIWPPIANINYVSSYSKTENMKLLEILIWYSQIKLILKEINEENDLMKNLRKLNDFEEMTYPREIFFTNLFKNTNSSQSGLTLKDKKQALYTLNANMILKLMSINESFINDPQKIYNIINNYMIRSSCDEREIQWIYQAVTKLSSDFCLQIPEFEPNDLVFLIVNKKSHSDYRNGPLFIGIENLAFLKKLNTLMHQKFYSFRDAAQSIARIAYCSIISSNEKPPSEYDKLKNAFNSQNRLSKTKYYIIERIQKMFYIADNLDNWKDHGQLLFNDVSFLSCNWQSNSELLNQFPSLFFWICKYQQVFEKLVQRYKDYSPNQKEIPLWIIALRIMSSKDCIEFETNSHSSISTIISDETSELTKKYLNHSKEQNIPINYDWISIFLSNLPPNISNPYIKIIHDFFNMLSMDNQTHPSAEINTIKNTYIREAISKITELILSGESQALIAEDISNSKSINQFLVFPSKYIQNKINEDLYDIIRSILENKSICQLKNHLNSISIFDEIIQKIQESIQNDQNEMKDVFNEKMKREYEKSKAKKIDETGEIIKHYNEIIYELIHNPNHKKINVNVKDLKFYQKQLQPYPELFENEGISLPTITYQSEYDFNVIIYRNNEMINLNFPKTGYNEQTAYLFPSEKYREYDNRSVQFHIKNITYTEFKYVHQQFDLDSIISQSTKIYKKKMPIIVFGNNYQDSTAFIKSLNELEDKLKSFNEKFFKILEFNMIIPREIFSFIKKTYNCIESIMKNLKAEFSDHSPSPNTRQILQGDFANYLGIIYPLIKDVYYLIQNKLYPIWKALNENMKFTKLFHYQYDIQIPRILKNPTSIPDFSVITNINSLASPTVCISPENKIICSVNILKCQIGPVFPSRIHVPYCINIISFIKEDVTYKIDHLSNHQYEKMITTKDKLNNNEPIQIFIMPPPATGNEPEILTLKGNINIHASSYDPFNLPFEFTLGILPIKARIRCHEYNLVEDKQSLILCCDRIESGATINFEVINNFIPDQFILAVEIESHDENEAKQPDIIINKIKHGFSLLLPYSEDPARCKFTIKVALSQNLITTIQCDFIIMPLVFAFEMFDFFSKKYDSINCQLMFISGSIQTLYFRVMCLFPFKQMAQINYYMPSSIQLVREDKPINEKFEINGNCTFNLKLRINPNSRLTIDCNYISLSIGNFKQSIQIKFVDPASYLFYPTYPNINATVNNEFLKKLPCYLYNYQNKKWNKLTNNDEIIKSKTNSFPFVIVSPYRYYTNIDDFNVVDYQNQNSTCVTVSHYQNIQYLKLTLTKHKDDLIINESMSSLSISKTKTKNLGFKTEIFTYYSILGYVNDNKNIWFPAFNQYPNVSKMIFLEYDESNAKTARDNITYMEKEILNESLNDSREEFNSYSPLVEKETNFAVFMALLKNKDIIINIECILDQMPISIKTQFNVILSKIKPYIDKGNKLSHDISAIISHNIIIKFAQVFQDKYDEIASHHFCLQFSLPKYEIENQQKIALDEFMKYDSEQTLKNSTSTTFQFSDKENKLLNISTTPLPNKSLWKECFIISENEGLIPCSLEDRLSTFYFDKSKDDESIFSDTIDSFASLPSIEIPETLSIANLNLFYSTCFQASKVLPSYIRSKQLKKLDQKDSEKCFANLLEIYKDITKESTLDRSILSLSVNSFIESFKNCVKMLKNVGIYFSNIYLPQSLSDCRYDFIHCPEIDIPILPHILWKTKNQILQTYDFESVDGLFSQFTELDGIKRVLRRIKEMKKDSKLKLMNNEEFKIEHQDELFATNHTAFPVQFLINNSQHLIAKLICKASEVDCNCPFLFMSCNLLIDCSSFISIENKLYSFMLLSSFSYALSALEIPFSIAIVADQKFRFILKPFEENISTMVLQRVFDCLFIKRYRTNLADTFYYAIEYMKCPYQERTQRAMFIFTNGLDENLVLSQSWKDNILNNQNNSFGLIFVKSKLLHDQKYSFIHEMWDNFNKDVETAVSITRLSAISSDISPKTFDTIASTFADVLSRKEDQKYQFDQNKIDVKPLFKPKFDDLQKANFLSVQKDINSNFNEVSPSIFRRINQKFDVICTSFPKLDVSCYLNKTEKIANSSPENLIKEEFDQFIHKIVNEKRNSYRPLLETIFKPNKASQTVLSSTGTDFDIEAFILNLINPIIPNPLIHL